jgi:hypothetical protein
MKMKKIGKRTWVLLGVVAAAAAVAVAGYAYWTSTGTGTSSATVGTSATWTVTGGSVVGNLFPGATASSAAQGVVTGASVTNASVSAQQNLGQIVATISGVTTAAGSTAACATTDFQFNSPGAVWSGSGSQTATISPNVNLAPGTSYSISGLNVAMVDNNGNQDRCKNQTVTVTFNAS